MNLLQVEGIDVSYGRNPVVQGVSFALDEGKIGCLLGPSGCGKTTVLRAVAGFEQPAGGEITIKQQLISGKGRFVPPERREIGMVFQDFALFPHMSVEDNIRFGIRKWSAKEQEARIHELLAMIGLPTQGRAFPHQRSGGQQQRVALARALAMRPSVVLFDEPLSNLDAKLREQVRREIRGLQREFGFTAIYVTHDQSEALAMSDRVVVLNGGRIEQIGAPEEVYQRPDTAFVADFIGSANLLPFERVEDHVVETALGRLTVSEPPGEATRFLCWRPEHAEYGVTEGDNVVSADVSELAYQGSYTDLHISFPGIPDQRLHWPGAASGVSDRVTFRLPPEHIRFVRGELG